jgi:SAM-dependent methyltransferase
MSRSTGKGTESWHSQDAFWELVEPMIFGPQRMANAPTEVEQIIRLLQLEQPARLLDLCCGVGRHALEFARQGFDVVGVDRTRRFIETARLAAEQAGVDAEFVAGDMRDFQVEGRFDAVLNLFGSFGYFEEAEDDRRVVERVCNSLRAGGLFLIETMGKEILARDFQEREWSQEGELLFLSHKQIRQDWSRVETHWIAIQGAQRVEHHVSVHCYSAAELSSLLKSCGFTAVKVYGDLQGIVYDQAAKRLVVLGRK